MSHNNQQYQYKFRIIEIIISLLFINFFHYSLPSQQYVQSLHLSMPTESSISSRRLNLNVVKCSSLQISSTIFSYFGESGSAYSCKTSSVTFPFSSQAITLLVMRSISEEDLEKLRYLHPKRRGGQAGLICTSFAPLS